MFKNFKKRRNQRNCQNYQATQNWNYRKKLSKSLGKGKQISHKYPRVSIKEGDIKFLDNWHRRYTKDDLIFVTKGKDYQPIWLEEGNEGNGFKHIKSETKNGQSHAKDIKTKFHVDTDHIPFFLKKVIKRGKITLVEKITPKKGSQKEGYNVYYRYRGKKFFIAVGDNGYIVTAYPNNHDKKGNKQYETHKNRK